MAATDQMLQGIEGGLTPAEVELPPELPSLPPGEWMKKNLFSSPFSAVMTLVFGAFALAALNILVDFIFSPERDWIAPATNLRLLLTYNYPESQYGRIWTAAGFITVLTGLSAGLWRAGSAFSMKRISTWFMSTGAFIAVAVTLAPFSQGKRITWYVVAAVAAAIGLAIWYGMGERRRTVFVPSVLVFFGALGLILLSLWTVRYGHYAFPNGEFIAEPGRLVAASTRIPWTIMFALLIGTYVLGRVLSGPINQKLKAVVGLSWLLSPLIVVWVILRIAVIEWDRVLSVDLPMALAFAVIGGAILYFFTKPNLGEIGKIAALALVGLAAFNWLAAFYGWYPMLQKARISFLLLGLVALIAGNFAGDRQTRLKLVYFWFGLMAVLHFFVTLMNTDSAVDIQSDFFLGGLSLTLFVAVMTLMISFPLGVLLALGRTSRLPIFRVLSTIYIEMVRGVPLITILIFFNVMFNIFLPSGMSISATAAIVTGFVLFSAAYLAENVRGGLQAIRRGQFEAADALGLTGVQRTGFIVMPQALRVSIPPLVGQAIGTWKETSLVAIIGAFDLLQVGNKLIPAQTQFLGVKTENLLIISAIYWVGAFSMSKYSQKLERKLGVGER